MGFFVSFNSCFPSPWTGEGEEIQIEEHWEDKKSIRQFKSEEKR
jgi:hypothetical protein